MGDRSRASGPPRDEERVSLYPAVDEDVSDAVVAGVSALLGCQPANVGPPLDEAVDPDALDRIFADRGAHGGRLRFRYAGCTVEVSADEAVVVARPARGEA